MEAVILAGGKGTRLREELGGLPKPLVDIGGKPLLERQLELLRHHGFSRAVVLVNHAAEQIEKYLASKDDFGMHLECVDDGTPRGTAGAVLAVLDRLPHEFLVMYGDTMLNVDLRRFHAAHAADPGAAATLLLHPNDHPADSDLVEVAEDGRVIAFHPYPHEESRYLQNLVNAALYWVRRDHLAAFRDRPGPLDFGKDLFPLALKRGAKLLGYNSPEYIKDAGTPDRLCRVRDDLATGFIDRSTLLVRQPMVLLDRDGTINREVVHLSSADDVELLPGAAEAIKRLNRSDYRCCVVTNQPVIARGECDFDDLRQIHNKLETLLGHDGAYVDRIYFCPHHPDRGFPGERSELKYACGCRKPETGMIDAAFKDFNGDPGRSWLIGDTSVDVEAAARSGIRSVLVETGHAGLDYRYWKEPDFEAADLAAAIAFILDCYPQLRRLTDDVAANLAAGSLVLIGGQSRSGKSSFASALRHSLADAGRRAVVLSLDRWLRSEADRAAGVHGRYQLDRVQSLLDVLGTPRTQAVEVDLPGYHKIRRECVPDVGSVSVQPDDVVILEGTLALTLTAPAAWPLHRLFVRIDEAERRQRVLREYARRGYTPEQAQAVYSERLAEEHPSIESTACGARTIDLRESTA